MEKDTNVGYRQTKLDTQAYEALKAERARLRATGIHASFSDAFRSLLGMKKTKAKQQKTSPTVETTHVA